MPIYFFYQLSSWQVPECLSSLRLLSSLLLRSADIFFELFPQVSPWFFWGSRIVFQRINAIMIIKNTLSYNVFTPNLSVFFLSFVFSTRWIDCITLAETLILHNCVRTQSLRLLANPYCAISRLQLFVPTICKISRFVLRRLFCLSFF